MANPRQRNKARSHKSTKPSLAAKRRLHHRLRKPPALKGPDVLQKGWDKHKTVFQNYQALGLLTSLPIPSGPSSSRSQKVRLSLPESESDPAKGKGAGAGFVGFGQIIRDEEGNVVDIIIPDEEVEPRQNQDEAMNESEEEGAGEEDKVEAKTGVVRSLEQLASSSKPIKRHSSTSEKTWLGDMVRTHGEDYTAMARDKRLNVWQKTEGEIKRMIRKAGGVDKLKARAEVA